MQAQIDEMVKNLLLNEPQSNFVWEVYPKTATRIAAELKSDRLKNGGAHPF